MLVQPTAEAVTSAWLQLLERPEEMRALAARGWQRVSDVYLPGIVAKRMKELGFEAEELFRRKQGR